MNPDASKFTAFGCELGLFEFNVMPMGLSNSMSTFNRLLTTIFGEYLGKFIIIYVDDILIFSRTIEEHKKHIKIVLDILEKHKLKIKLSKCELFTQEVEFLGHMVGPNQIRPNTDRIKALESTRSRPSQNKFDRSLESRHSTRSSSETSA